MITPRFSLKQTDTNLIITIIAPYTNVKDTEIYVFEDDFRFSSNPYYLRLALPGKVEETDKSSAKYVVDSQSFVVTLDKMHPGEFFEKLDMLTLMLQPRKQKPEKPLIEVLSSESHSNDESIQDDDETVTLDENMWMIEQHMEEETPSEVLLQNFHYGFANLHSGLKDNFGAELNEITMIRNPDSTSYSKRKESRIEGENKQFSDDHYLYDLMENPDIDRIIGFRVEEDVFLGEFSEEERDLMMKFKNNVKKMDLQTEKRLMLGLFDIIYAYHYDLQISEGKHCVESPWNISRLSSTLAWFDSFDTPRDVLLSILRRSLAYPLYRNWNLSLTVLKHTLWTFRQGQHALLKCLLAIHRMFSKRAPYYLHNQLYIDEYCMWIQYRTDAEFETMVSVFEKEISSLKKQELEFDLIELETAAKFVMEDEEMAENLSDQISRVAM